MIIDCNRRALIYLPNTSTMLCFSIFAGGNKLTGEIPSELGLLTSLEELELGHNNINGNIPTELGSISRLQLIQLDNNNLPGSIPTEFGFLSSLEVIVIGKHSMINICLNVTKALS